MGQYVRQSLTGEEICKIIEACANGKVLEFSYKDIRIVFGSKENVTKDSSDVVTENPIVKEDERDPSIKRVEKFRSVKEEVEEALITDPMAFEEAMTSEEFLDEEDQKPSRPT